MFQTAKSSDINNDYIGRGTLNLVCTNMEVERDKEEVDDYVLDVDEDFNVAKRKKRKSYKDVYKNTFKVLART
ncbi:hypothetical protein Tco_0027355 [Tanacetum coccineum]